MAASCNSCFTEILFLLTNFSIDVHICDVQAIRNTSHFSCVISTCVKLLLSLWLHFILAQLMFWHQNSSQVEESNYGADTFNNWHGGGGGGI
jgi:hypothetical protein